MRICLHCNINTVPNRIKIDDKWRNLKNRKYCLECSPFGKHNTRKIESSNVEKFCKICNKTSTRSRSICDSCRVTNSRRKLKLKLIEYMGGKCSICSYNNCIGALEFHHKDPTEKEFILGNNSRSYDAALKEALKCILLCANCHREAHYKEFEIW
jgi:hypothetical protein